MKKVLLFTLIIINILMLCSCSIKNNNEQQKDNIDKEIVADTVPEEKRDVWRINYYLDDFNQETNEWYVTNSSVFSGSFSNTATTNSLLTGYAMIDPNLFSFLLYEYGNLQVKNPLSHNVYYEVKMRNDSGDEYNGYAGILDNGDRIILNDKTRIAALNYMKSSKEVNFYIKEEDGMSSYVFTLETDNFSELYN